jgi:mannose-1-phosphate guanylyltransferase
MSADAFREVADMKAFDLAFDVLPRFIGRMHGWVWDGYHRDIGTLESLQAAEREAPLVFGESVLGGVR